MMYVVGHTISLSTLGICHLSTTFFGFTLRKMALLWALKGIWALDRLGKYLIQTFIVSHEDCHGKFQDVSRHANVVSPN